jgi:hypothetical protein
MSKENRAEDSYTTIKASEKDDSYLEEVSGEESIEVKLQQTTCSICGLSARTREELQEHIKNAHKEASAKE